MALIHRPRHVDAVLVSLAWRRATIIEHFTWEFEHSSNRPFGSHVRNIREYWDGNSPAYEFEKQVWREGREVTTSGDSQAGVAWAEFSLWPNERVKKQAESYTARFQLATPESGFSSSGKSPQNEHHEHHEHHTGIGHLHHSGHEWHGEWKPEDSVRPDPDADSDSGEAPLDANLDEQTWRSLETGMTYRLEINVLGHVHSVTPVT